MNFTNQISWLAGIIDGEGHIGIYKHNRGDGTYKIAPTVTITNTDPNIINQVDKIIRKIGVIPYVQEKYPDEKAWNKCYFVKIQNHKDIGIVLETIVSYLIGNKRALAQLVLRFVNSRMHSKENGRISKGPKSGYTEQEVKVYELIRGINKRGRDKKLPPPETIRETLQKSDDIVRTHNESVRNEQK